MLPTRLARVLGAGVVVLAAVLGACSDDDPPVPPAGNPGTSGGTSSGSSGSGGDGGGTSSGGSSGGDDSGSLVNGCRSFVDRTADDADRSIPWDFDVFDLPERCMQIKVGQKVTFKNPEGDGPADLVEHPIGPQGGDSPNPIANIDKDTGEVTFDQPGVFGYVCLVHGAMTGAILVGP